MSNRSRVSEYALWPSNSSFSLSSFVHLSAFAAGGRNGSNRLIWENEREEDTGRQKNKVCKCTIDEGEIKREREREKSRRREASDLWRPRTGNSFFL